MEQLPTETEPSAAPVAAVVAHATPAPEPAGTNDPHATPAPQPIAALDPSATPGDAPATDPATGASAAMATLPATYAQMRLKVGAQLHLDPARRTAGGRATVTLLGWLEGQSVLVTAPQNTAGCLVLQQGERVRLRAFNGKSAFAFRATVLKLAYLPFSYLHLSFPDRIEGVAIRTSPRCRLRLPVAITAGGSAASRGNILNIGTTGALIESDQPLGMDDGLIQIAFSLDLHGVRVSLDLRAQVCGEKSPPAAGSASLRKYGVEFRELQPNDRLILGSLVWYQIYEDPRSVI